MKILKPCRLAVFAERFPEVYGLQAAGGKDYCEVVINFPSDTVPKWVIKIHSPMRAEPNCVVKWVPSRGTIRAARITSEKLLKRVGAGSGDPLAACSTIKKIVERKPIALSNLRKAAADHQKFVKGTTMYPLEQSLGHGALCTVPAN
ncbi:sialyltransferase-like protein 2 [Corylus avellana]|uniref:sialyltransferase-like protein 2 n=1 Tax=Corylus avellana TaxID=13451 RepID=UPI00286A3B20|nr:sialyltransferase-like protein 2 [Corylus avellana]